MTAQITLINCERARPELHTVLVQFDQIMAAIEMECMRDPNRADLIMKKVKPRAVKLNGMLLMTGVL